MPRPLTPDETQILDLAAQGYSPHNIAHRNGIERRLVDNAIARAVRALGARDLHHAIQIHNTPAVELQDQPGAAVTDLTPAQELRAAAQALEDAANATLYEIRHESYWQPTEDTWQRGITNAVGGRAGEFCALMSPDVAKAFTELLRATASEMDAANGTEYRALGDGHDFAGWNAALAVARAILTGGVS